MILWIINVIVKNNNLKLFNKYKYYSSLIPLNTTYYKITDRFANYSNEIKENDKHYSFFEFWKIHIANRAFKRIISDYESFLDAYKSIDPLKGKWWFESPFKGKFHFPIKWNGQTLHLSYEIRDIPLCHSISEDKFFVYFKLTDQCLSGLTNEQKFYLSDHKYICLPKWTISRLEDKKDTNLIIDNDLKRKKYKIRRFIVKKITPCTIQDYQNSIEEKREREMAQKYGKHDYYPNSSETDELFKENAINFLSSLGFVMNFAKDENDGVSN
ncbi:MAG: hypothetical protein ACOQNY_01455 [Mycoplasmoidaceae bacterium]